MAQSQNSTVDLATPATCLMGLTSHGNVMVGNKAFEYYNERNPEDYIQIPWDEVDYIAAEVLRGTKKITRFAIFTKDNGHFTFTTRDDKETLRAVRKYVDEDKLVRSPDFIDVNFGCPAPNAVGAGAGSLLLRDTDKMCKIVRAMAQGVKKTPITAKMRTGWSKSEIVVPAAAEMLQDAGAKMITLHGRTKSQGYSGDADWGLIEKTAQSIKIPLIGNGSVEKLSAQQLRSSACFGFMIGRAALGNPWVFLQVKSKIDGREYQSPTPAERAKLALKYAELMCDGRDSGVSADNITHIRSQTIRFLKDGAGFKAARVRILKTKTLDELREILCEFL